jgi:hypothetical protein
MQSERRASPLVKETIDIEALLHRAYGHYRVDRLARAAFPAGPRASPASGLARLLALGTRIDGTNIAAAAIAAARDELAVPDDVVRLHQAVLALEDCFAETAGAESVVWDRDVATAHGQWIEIEGGLPWIAPAELERDPCTGAVRKVRLIWEERRKLDRISRTALVIQHARAGSRPLLLTPKVSRMRQIYDHNRNRIGEEPVHDPPLDVIAFHRADYAAWWDALAMLAVALRTCEHFTVTGPAARRQPWEAAPRKILQPEKPRRIKAKGRTSQHTAGSAT